MLVNQFTESIDASGFAKVKGVIKACQQSDISVFPWITEFAADLSVFDEHQKHSLEEYQAHFGPDYIRKILQRYWISMGGRALETFGPYTAGKIIAIFFSTPPPPK